MCVPQRAATKARRMHHSSWGGAKALRHFDLVCTAGMNGGGMERGSMMFAAVQAMTDTDPFGHANGALADVVAQTPGCVRGGHVPYPAFFTCQSTLMATTVSPSRLHVHALTKE